MTTTGNIHSYIKELSDHDFGKLSAFIYSNYGIKMPQAKKSMLQARLQSRLRETRYDNFKDYCEFVFSGNGSESEVVHMIDVVSTNKTDFFRESAHFEFMKNVALTEICGGAPSEKLKIWSSACSSGEEVYTIAITMEEYLAGKSQADYTILGTDISSRILQRASDAIYNEERIAAIPLELKRRYFLRSKNKTNPTVRVVKELRDKTHYQRLNLMDDRYNVPSPFDIVFCRNVLIYFDRKTQEAVINKLCSHLKSGGYFFLGHSESITGISVPLKQIKPTIFKKI